MSEVSEITIELTEGLTTAVKTILEAAGNESRKPRKISATYGWEETDYSESLVPQITIEWFE